MNCPQCGNRIWSDYLYCKSCGVTLHSPSSEVATLPSSIDSELKGVGGWLLFFCILVTIFAPIFFLTSLRFGDGLTIVLGLFQMIIEIVAGINVWSVNELAFSFLKIYFATSVAMRTLRLLVSLIFLLSGYSQNHVETGFIMVASLIGIGITISWIGYFRYSERIRATFGSNLIFPF